VVIAQLTVRCCRRWRASAGADAATGTPWSSGIAYLCKHVLSTSQRLARVRLVTRQSLRAPLSDHRSNGDAQRFARPLRPGGSHSRAPPTPVRTWPHGIALAGKRAAGQWRRLRGFALAAGRRPSIWRSDSTAGGTAAWRVSIGQGG